MIALMLFFLNLSFIIVDELGIFNYNIATSDKWREDVELAETSQFDPDISGDVQSSFGFGDFTSGFRLFRDMIFRVAFMGDTLRLFGIDDTIASMFSFAGSIIYILGVAQFISNRSLKGMF